MAGKKFLKTEVSMARAKKLIEALEDYGELSQTQCSKLLGCCVKTVENLIVTVGGDNLIYQYETYEKSREHIYYGIILPIKKIKKPFDSQLKA